MKMLKRLKSNFKSCIKFIKRKCFIFKVSKLGNYYCRKLERLRQKYNVCGFYKDEERLSCRGEGRYIDMFCKGDDDPKWRTFSPHCPYRFKERCGKRNIIDEFYVCPSIANNKELMAKAQEYFDYAYLVELWATCLLCGCYKPMGSIIKEAKQP